MACAKNSFDPPGMGEKRRQVVAVGRRKRRPGGRSLHDRVREGWEEAVGKREIEAALTGKQWGAIGNRSGGREKRNG